MKLVVFGLSISSAWGNGHATLWRGLGSALQSMGHELVFFERDVPYYAAHRDPAGAAACRLLLYPSWDAIRARALAEVGSCDAAIVTSYCPDGRAACELVLDARAPMRIFYDLDTPITLARLEAGEDVPYLPREGLSGFDLVLSFTGGPSLDQLASRLGARRTAPLFGSVDVTAHRPTPAEERFRADLSYLGTYAEDRQIAVEQLFVEPARRLRRRKFLLAGAMYDARFPWAPNIWHIEHVAPPQHPAFYGSSRLSLNVTRSTMARSGWCPSGRLFEAAACEVAQISDAWPGLSSFFEPGREILVAERAEDVCAALEVPDEQLGRIRRRARERVLAEHTASHRARELLDHIGVSERSVAARSMQEGRV